MDAAQPGHGGWVRDHSRAGRFVAVFAPLSRPYEPYALDPRLIARAAVGRAPVRHRHLRRGHLLPRPLRHPHRLADRVLRGGDRARLSARTVGAVAGFSAGGLDEVAHAADGHARRVPGIHPGDGRSPAALGPSIPNLIVAIAFVNVPVYARLMRARFLVIRTSAVRDGGARRRRTPLADPDAGTSCRTAWHRSSSSRRSSSAGRSSTRPG